MGMEAAEAGDPAPDQAGQALCPPVTQAVIEPGFHGACWGTGLPRVGRVVAWLVAVEPFRMSGLKHGPGGNAIEHEVEEQTEVVAGAGCSELRDAVIGCAGEAERGVKRLVVRCEKHVAGGTRGEQGGGGGEIEPHGPDIGEVAGPLIEGSCDQRMEMIDFGWHHASRVLPGGGKMWFCG